MRKDLYIYNEATGFVITSKSLNGRLKKIFPQVRVDGHAREILAAL